MNILNITKKNWVVILSVFIAIFGFTFIWNPPPGLFDPEPIGPFVNGNLPSIAPDDSAPDIEVTPVYENIVWESPIGEHKKPWGKFSV